MTRCTCCHDVLIVKNLNRWFKEKWVDVSRKNKDGKHPPCGRSKANKSSKGYPKCRPSVKVSSKTPKTSGSMTTGQKQAATKRKRSKKQGVGGKPTIVGIATGMVAGLATITPAAGSVGPEGALLIGLMAGSICFYATQAVKGVFGIDDSLDVFPVHGVGGIIGIIMVSFLGVQGGFLGSSAGESWVPMEQFLIQMKGIAVIGAWTAIASWAILKLIGSFTPLRVTEEEEYEGLDVVEHEERSYDLI